MGTLPMLRINLQDVETWLRSLPDETQFDMQSNDACLFSQYLKVVYPTREALVGSAWGTLNGKKYELESAVSLIIALLHDWDCEEEHQYISRDEALAAVENVMHKSKTGQIAALIGE